MVLGTSLTPRYNFLITMTSLTPIHSRHHSRNGFTLIELLVVISIIAILAGIAFPVFAMARARADGAACMANLRQIGAAIAGYAADNDGSLPGPAAQAQKTIYSTADTTQLAELLSVYLSLPAPTGSPQKAPIMTCPAFAKVTQDPQMAVYAIDSLYQANPGAGAATLVPIYSSTGQVWAFGNTGGTPGVNGSGSPMKIAGLTTLTDQNGNPGDPSRMVALRDYLGGSSATLVLGGGGGTVTYNSGQPVHKTYLNALFFDWHVGLLNPKSLMPQ
jgi:prepilin-type N-terminal cleavage/methylation domain-containing protein/prepilin-type processing-associated H-X9-DG protein